MIELVRVKKNIELHKITKNLDKLYSSLVSYDIAPTKFQHLVTCLYHVSSD